ncbi:2-amino-4-hydroxy-6-hydroxymethyldihydropteridine diphosphokinase [Rhodobacter maris]|uniref:2-amino-4-hydroxy-6-hydroxymethyldihydropteridine pyrophosphokinase n=1 Tax=Rhodobacter maris TaxID=446682 RepID=A0A285RRL1_9RHOB|nr:2-amino-4-hydroxy-6-hydroxymethyldihydropteridine diphosphokinase [Rhodobacter maris]SOB94957.1 2-amino-4-hydroxy-6-hydroxymethyldihydropteridinediphosphokinase [Rhodobacter maris]
MYNNTILIGLGSNLPGAGGTPAQTLLKALGILAKSSLAVLAVSRFYRTPAFPAGSGPDYVNACARLAGPGSPEEILAALHRVEAALGRVRSTRWAARGIDLDLLGVGDAVLPDAATEAEWRLLPLERQIQIAPEGLILPHPRLADRAFVLVPLAEIAPNWRHPVTGASVARMLAALDPGEKAALEPFLTPVDGIGGLSSADQPTK